MGAQFKTLSLVALLEIIEILAFYLISWIGLGSYHALNGVGGVALLTIIVSGVALSKGLEDKAHSPKGSPRLSLDSNVFMWCGFATVLAITFANGVGDSLKSGGYLYTAVQIGSIAILCVLASRALGAEVTYDARKEPQSMIYLPFFLIATALPAMLGILPLWAVIGVAVLQLGLVVALLVSPWSPIERRSRKAA